MTWEVNLLLGYIHDVQISVKSYTNEVNFPGKSTFPGSQLFWEVKYPGKLIFWEVNFPRKSTFLGSQLSQEVNFPISQFTREVKMFTLPKPNAQFVDSEQVICFLRTPSQYCGHHMYMPPNGDIDVQVK